MGAFHNFCWRYALALCGLIGGGQAMHAQTITGYRYWFDDDVASATTVSVLGGTTYTLNAAFNTSVLAPGYHRISLQFEDSNGDFAVPITSVFSRQGSTIAAYEYWFDDAPGNAVAVPVGGGGVYEATVSLDASSLESGYHRVTLRTQDDAGVYSAPITSTFVQRGSTVNGYEYWIDDDIAARVTGTTVPANVVDLVTDLPINTTAGTHLFTIRFSDELEGWSVPITTEFSFTVGMEELPGVESVLIFPNPAENELWLRIDASTEQDLTVELLDATGRVVKNATRMVVSRSGTIAINVSDLPTGSYQVLLTGAQGTTSLPFVRQ
ncbi:MAG: T9SS type A sorting domain-containing protein [Flavobacteriales bacterium]|nr:T9SS type A sorting domain-containing protein [Flavobacteriales bacterium]MBP6697038.1 T9SS type A sorting domain-containing protein [Flavobacteriales bacterium]